MAQKSAVAQILERITQETSQLDEKQPIFGIKAKRASKSKPTTISISISPPLPQETTKKTTFGSQWNEVSDSIDSLIKRSHDTKYETAFQTVEQLSRDPSTHKLLYDHFIDKMNQYSNVAMKDFDTCATYDELINIWLSIRHTISLISSIFASFERVYIYPSSITSISFDILSKAVHSEHGCLLKICNLISASVKDARQESIANGFSVRLKTLADISSSIQLSQDLLPFFSSDIEAHYANLLSLATLSDEVNSFCLLIENEKSLFSLFPISINLPVIEVAKHHIYVTALESRMSDFVSDFFSSRNIESLRSLVALVEESPSLKPLLFQSWNMGLQEMCKSALMKKGLASFRDLFGIHSFLDECSKSIVFSDYSDLYRTFKASISRTPAKIAFLCAKFCHKALLSDSQIFERDSQEIIKLVMELDSIDGFLEYYSQFMASRILTTRKVVSIAENGFISELGRLCGEDSIANIKGMMEDALMSQEINKKIRLDVGFETSFTLISSSGWPKYPQGQNLVPSEIAKAQAMFVKRYTNDEPRKRLEWLATLDECEFEVNGEKVSGSSYDAGVVEKLLNHEEIPKDDLMIKDCFERLIRCGLVVMVDNKHCVGKLSGGRIEIPKISSFKPKPKQEDEDGSTLEIREKRAEALIVRAVKIMGRGTPAEIFGSLQKDPSFPVTKEFFDKTLERLVSKGFLGGSVQSTVSYSLD